MFEKNLGSMEASYSSDLDEDVNNYILKVRDLERTRGNWKWNLEEDKRRMLRENNGCWDERWKNNEREENINKLPVNYTSSPFELYFSSLLC